MGRARIVRAIRVKNELVVDPATRCTAQGLAKRLGVSPNRPVWSGAAVQAPKEGRSREATTRCIIGLDNVNQSIYGPSQPRHTLVLEWFPATSAPSVQTAKRCHVWLIGRLEPTPS